MASVEWVATTKYAAGALTLRAVVGGHENNKSPLWVIRTQLGGDMIPGKLAVERKEAYVPWGGKEHLIDNIEVCCASSEKVEWIECKNGNVPPGAVKAGWTACGETLYVGRAHHDGSLTPGNIQPSKGVLNITYGGKVISYNVYEVLCAVN